MILGIDVDLLKKRRDELQTEIARIDSILQLADGGVTAGLNGAVTVTTKPSLRAGVQRSGLRKQVLLNLFTGPATERDLARVLNWPISDVHQTLHAMLRDNIVASKDQLFTLTTKGRQMASWHQQNPHATVYAGDKL